ncbi:hypothetical protein FKW77_000710 [Venturia effusa]|uniref:Uncharacterized protein n=1 Tax=Venturia effusa TaxID=50376 RepID=A0A517LRH0_9PEZI|nr:hypothetical protein FKW77_000710 [Venturia effusa]
MHSPGSASATSPPYSASKKSKSAFKHIPDVPVASVATPPDSNSESHLSDHHSEDEQDTEEKDTPTSRFIALISKYSSQGTLAPADRVLTISPENFYKAQHALRQNKPLWAFFISKVRYDYDGQTVTLRMPSKLHEYILAGVANTIDQIIYGWRNSKDDQIKRLALRIDPVRSTPVELSPSPHSKSIAEEEGRSVVKATKSPDACYQYEDQTTFVLEVAISESNEAALVKTEEYFEKGSSGAVQTVIYVFGRNLDDNGAPRSVTLDRYRVSSARDEYGKYCGESECDYIIHSTPSPQTYEKLDLSLSDFVPQRKLEEVSKNHPDFKVPIESVPLDSFYNLAREKIRKDEKAKGQSRGKASIVWTRKRPRGTSSPSEETRPDEVVMRMKSSHPEAEYDPTEVDEHDDEHDDEHAEERQRVKKPKIGALLAPNATRSASGQNRRRSSRLCGDENV